MPSGIFVTTVETTRRGAGATSMCLRHLASCSGMARPAGQKLYQQLRAAAVALHNPANPACRGAATTASSKVIILTAGAKTPQLFWFTLFMLLVRNATHLEDHDFGHYHRHAEVLAMFGTDDGNHQLMICKPFYLYTCAP